MAGAHEREDHAGKGQSQHGNAPPRNGKHFGADRRSAGDRGLGHAASVASREHTDVG